MRTSKEWLEHCYDSGFSGDLITGILKDMNEVEQRAEKAEAEVEQLRDFIETEIQNMGHYDLHIAAQLQKRYAALKQ